MSHDPVNHPRHYTEHPSGVECIQITEHMGFCLGNAVKYLFRREDKTDPIEDIRKAAWYIDREIERRHDYDVAFEEYLSHEPPSDVKSALELVWSGSVEDLRKARWYLDREIARRMEVKA